MAKIISTARFRRHALDLEVAKLYGLLRAHGHRSFFGERDRIRPYIVEALKTWLPHDTDYREVVTILESGFQDFYQTSDGVMDGAAWGDEALEGLSVVDAAAWRTAYEDPQWRNVAFLRPVRSSPGPETALHRLLRRSETPTEQQ